MQLVIGTDGNCRCIYDEAIDLHALGQLQIERASHVEPTADSQWTADLSPVTGPVLGPFRCRAQALTAEVDWLANHWLVTGTDAPSQEESRNHEIPQRDV